MASALRSSILRLLDSLFLEEKRALDIGEWRCVRGGESGWGEVPLADEGFLDVASLVRDSGGDGAQGAEGEEGYGREAEEEQPTETTSGCIHIRMTPSNLGNRTELPLQQVPLSLPSSRLVCKLSIATY